MASLSQLVNLDNLTVSPMDRMPSGMDADGVRDAILETIALNRRLVEESNPPKDERVTAMLERAAELAERAAALAEEARRLANDARAYLEQHRDK